ncbi:MAG TPA: TetR family transcriptional regulator [Gaiellaceae bacterium]|nr:TetR family transcriptional regulator [Gaiellaceae bacterium]
MGLREFKKQHTRRNIADEAMRLFVQRGFDAVTVAEVAEAAQVSEKTVFNYFPTKEDLFYDEVPAREAALVAAIRDRAPGDSVLGALRRLQVAECPRLCSPSFATFARIIEDSPALQAKELEVMAHFAHVLSEGIRQELRIDERDARIAAGLLISIHRQVFRAARRQALDGKQGAAAVRRLRADLNRAYELLEHGLSQLDDPAAPIASAG